jgi:hypothetical protein
MIEILMGKIQWSFLAQFRPASIIGVSSATRAENSGGCIGNDQNSDRDHSRSKMVAVHGTLCTTPPRNSNQ